MGPALNPQASQLPKLIGYLIDRITCRQYKAALNILALEANIRYNTTDKTDKTLL